jgi:hypothetical protein
MKPGEGPARILANDEKLKVSKEEMGVTGI